MVDASYMEARPGKPSTPKRVLDQVVVPAFIDAAGCMEAGLERLAVAVRGRPATLIGGAIAVGLGLGLLLLPKRRR